MSGSVPAGFPPPRARMLRVALAGAVVAAAAFLAALAFGPTEVDLARAVGDPGSLDARKVFDLRLPRAVATAIVGAALSLAGLIFQALLQNPLASPYVLGVSAGGSLGAAVAALCHLPSFQGPAFLGSLLAILLVYGLGWHRPGESPVSLLLAGVIVNSFLSALILLIQVVLGHQDRDRLFRWLVGGFPEVVERADLARSGACLLSGALICLWTARSLGLLSLGESTAARLGVDVGRQRPLLFLVASLLTGAAVALAGPVGFVGLIIPHLARLMLGNDHRLLVIGSLFLGAAFLTLVDVLGRSLFPAALPTGVMTAFLGGPFFLVLLRRARRPGGGAHAL